MTQETNNLAADLWALADLLRGDFKQSQYGRVILPFALLRRLECVLESSKSAVLLEAPKVEKMVIAEEAKEKLLLRAAGGLSFFQHLAHGPEHPGRVGHQGQFGALHPVLFQRCPRDF